PTSAEIAAGAHAVQTPYMVLGAAVLLWAAIVALTPFPAVATERVKGDGGPGSVRDFAALAARPLFLFRVLAQFCYVGAQAGVFSFMIRYAQHAMGAMNEAAASAYLFASIVGFMLGRFIGTALMWRIAPWLIMTAFALINVALMTTAAMAPGQVGLYAMVAT